MAAGPDARLAQPPPSLENVLEAAGGAEQGEEGDILSAEEDEPAAGNATGSSEEARWRTEQAAGGGRDSGGGRPLQEAPGGAGSAGRWRLAVHVPYASVSDLLPATQVHLHTGDGWVCPAAFMLLCMCHAAC